MPCGYNMKFNIHHKVPLPQTYRVARISSLFNIETNADFRLSAELPIEEKAWQIGLIVEPSGSGKSFICNKLFNPMSTYSPKSWPKDTPIIEAINPDDSLESVTSALTSVGLGSVPSWLRSYHHLSTDEKFRADLAQILCNRPKIVVVDEFTSTIDRQVATIASSAFAKSWRRASGKFIAATCHYDVIDWLQPDWVFDTKTGVFAWRRLRRPPSIKVEIYETNWRYWPLFEPHHYLKLHNMIAATCYVGFVNNEPIAHIGVTTRVGMIEARVGRLVVLPEWQGIGIGMNF